MKERYRAPYSIFGVVTAIGIVFGDIGTSPLYVMRVILNSLPENGLTKPEYILGTVSCVIWTLTIQTTLKYMIITLRADNKGEGGILSLYALVRKKYRWAFLIGALGAASLLADGIITPAITVISAIEGLNDIVPQIPVVPVTVAIVFSLFMVQPFGTGALGKYFGRFMVLWFSMMAIVGMSHLIHHPGVLKAFNPLFAIRFLIETPNTLILLGAIFLCTTGAEALYSDLGHCGLKNIRTSWTFVKISLIINYLGQAAWILNHPQSVSRHINPFFSMMPEWFTGIGVAMAALAAIFASQALISGSFSVISEAISLNLWPNVKVKYPTLVKGQMYIPSINYMMMGLCIGIIFLFGSSLRLEAAYGLAITLSMMMTSALLFLYFNVKKINHLYSIPLTLFFIFIELNFFIANLQKFAHGGFAPVLIGGLICLIMCSWYNGRRIKKKHTSYDEVDANYINRILKISEDKEIPKFATHLVYMVKANRKNNMESKIAYSLFRKTPKRADTYWFIHIVRSDEPYEFRYETTIMAPQKIFRIDLYIGFKVEIHADKYVALITQELERNGKVDLSTRYPSMQGTGNNRGDYKFMVVDRNFRDIHSMSLPRRIVLNCYNLIKRLSTSDTQMYDLDESMSVVEIVPLDDDDPYSGITDNVLKNFTITKTKH